MPRTRLQNRRDRRGFTLTESAVVLGVIGIVLSAIWIAAAQVSNANKVQKADAEVMQILSGYKSFYAQAGIDQAVTNPFGNFNDVTCIGINAGFFPAEMNPVCSADGVHGSANNPWVTASAALAFPPVFVSTQKTYNTILISYNDLPQSACVQFASSAFNLPGVIYQSVVGGTYLPNNQYLPPYKTNTPYSESQILGLCSGGVGSNPYDVQVGFAAR